MSESLWHHESQHERPPCPSPTPGVHSDSCASSQWCHSAISSSVIPLSSYPQSHPSSKSFSMGQHFAWGGQSTGVSALASFLPKKSQKASILWQSAFFTVQLPHPYMTKGKTIALTRWTFVGKVMSLLFNMLSRLVITFLPRNKNFLISWLQSPSAVILEPKKDSLSLFPLFPHLFPMKWWDQMPWIWKLDCEESWTQKNWCFWTVVLEKDSCKSLGLQGDPTSPS